MIRIGCVQFAPMLMNIEANLQKIRECVATANADILIFPELALTGYFFTSYEQAREYAEPVHGSLVLQIQEIARTHKTAIVCGFLEADGEKLYNSAVAIDSNGLFVGHYRKVHLFAYENLVFSKGNLGFPVCSIRVRSGESFILGMQICYDWRFPEATRSLAIKGAELVAIPSNIVTTTGMLHDTLRVRAFENKVIIAFADRIGLESANIDGKKEELAFRGESCIINFNGQLLAIGSTHDESITYADVFTEETRSKTINIFNNIIGDRQSEMYFT